MPHFFRNSRKMTNFATNNMKKTKRKKHHVISKDKEPDILVGKPDISSYLDRYPDAVALCERMSVALMRTMVLTMTDHLQRNFNNDFILDINPERIRKAVDLLDKTSLKVLLCSLRAIHIHLFDKLVFVLKKFDSDFISDEMEIVNVVLNQVPAKVGESETETDELKNCWHEIRECVYAAQANTDSESIGNLTIGTSPRYIGRVHDIYAYELRKAIRFLPAACRIGAEELVGKILDDIDEIIRKSKPLFTKSEIAGLVDEIRHSHALSPRYERILNDIDIDRLRHDDYPVIRSGLKYIAQFASKRADMDATGAAWLQRLQRISYALD